MGETGKTDVSCRSDCQFALNKERKCSLRVIALQQTQGGSSLFNCNQYVQGKEKGNRYMQEDMNRAREAGIYETFSGKLKK